jgi:hypothetical protein
LRALEVPGASGEMTRRPADCGGAPWGVDPIAALSEAAPTSYG